jgi:PPK2 family polyphosphate:nucleotide phosphotransferase
MTADEEQSMDLRKRLIVEPGSRFRLKHVDPGFSGGHATEAEAQADIAKNVARLTRLQELLYAERRHALLIVLQGIDAAGKDGTCWHVMTAMNPQGTTVTGFKQPTADELAHDFLWRVHPHAPGRGQVAVFNRSHYEDVLVVRVHKLVPKKVWSKRYAQINEFERLLAATGTTILKFFLYISPEEQLARFKARLDDPMKNWKSSDSDYTERARWDDYARAYQDMLEQCSTRHAPWYVIPSNHKWFRDLAVSEIVARVLEDLRMQAPKPSVDLAKIRQEHHSAATAARP